MKFKPLACGFHSHTDLSLDGASTVEAKIKNAAKLGRVADCVTDHGIMSALMPHWMAAQKLYKDKKIDAPIQSIHGIEAYIIDPDRPPITYKNGKTEPRYMHLTIHFKTARAYQHFCSLTPIMESRAIVKYAERKPLLKLEELEPISGEITIGSGCLVGPVQKNVLMGRSDLAEKMYLKLRELAGPGNFFAEIFPHIIDKEWKRPQRDSKGTILQPGQFVPATQKREEEAIDPPFDVDPCTGLIDIQKRPNEFVRMMALKYGDPIVISLDDHYACKEDRIVQEARLGNGREDWKFYGYYNSSTSDEHVVSLQKQLGISDKEAEEWVDNSYRFVDLFKDYKMETAKDRWLLPTSTMIYADSANKTNTEKLYELIKYHNRMPQEGSEQYQQYKERLEYELSVLTDNGVADFLPYFFVLEDAARYAKENNIMWNTRGSAGGSLILFLIGVSITDPIKYELPFERFLTLGRIKSGSLPDIDSDWEDREIILNYLREKYGESIALISTDMMLRLKSSILDVERATRGSVSEETTKMCKSIKGAPQGKSDRDWLFGYLDKTTGEHVKGFWEDDSDPASLELREWAGRNPEMWETVQKCIGITKNRGVHAGGVVITPGPASNYVPLVESKVGLATAYSMKPVENGGCIKYDFLGVSTLKALGIAINSIYEHTGKRVEWGEFPHDEKVYENIIFKNLLSAIFQLNTRTVRPYAQQIRPKTIKEIAMLTSLIRPGALDAPSPDPADTIEETAVTYYVKCAQKQRQPYFIHQDLEPILGETFGVIVTQEQALRIFRDLAGYTYETAEEVRRGIGKKDEALLNKHSEVLLQKCKERGWTEDQAKRLFSSIMASARYSFNASHATSYAIVAYNGCWLKYHYPVHFWKGELSIHTDDHDKLREYINECGHLLLPIDIERSHPSEWTIEGDKLRPPLSLLKGCGALSAEKFKTFYEKQAKQYTESCAPDSPKYSWAILLNDLAAGKKAKTTTGINMGGIAVMLFSGAIDSLLPEAKDDADAYIKAYGEIRKALKSTAKLPEAKKTEMIGLANVNDAATLSLWRQQTNPMSSFDIITSFAEQLKMYGFEVTNHVAYPMKKPASPKNGTKTPVLLTPYWGKVFQNPMAISAFESGQYELAVLGIVTSAEARKYAEGTKERLVFKLFTGTEYTDEVTVWPDRNGNLPQSVTSAIKPMQLGFAVIRPKIWNGRPGGALLRWHTIVR